jgi:hypothetical protein
MYHLDVPRPIYATTLAGMRACLTALGYSGEMHQDATRSAPKDLHYLDALMLSGSVPWLGACCIACMPVSLTKL